MPTYILVKENPFDDINDSTSVFEAEDWDAALARFLPQSVEELEKQYRESNAASYDGWEDWAREFLVDDFESDNEFQITGLVLREVSREERLDDEARHSKQVLEEFKQKMEGADSEEAERKEYERLHKKYGKKRKKRK